MVSRIDHYEEPAEDGKRVFLIVMPLFRCSLRYAVGRMNPVGIRNAFCQVIEGLKYLHSRGFLHRDIKPENIFISALTPPFDATLGDLGILSPVDAVGRGAGTRIYKAPEVYYDDLQSPATDVYALGVTLLQMVDERARKGGYDGMTKWIEDIRDHPPPAPFSRLIMQMLAPYPPSLRPTLDTVQKHLLEQKDLPESVQQPGLSLSEAMKKLEERRAKSALGDRQVALAVPLKNPVEAHPKLKKTVLHQGSILINPITGRLNPLEIVCRGRLPARHDPKTVECGVRGPFKLQPATHMRHRGRGPTIVEREVPGPSRRRPAAHDSTPAAAQQESEQHPSTQAVDFSQGTIEPDNPFMRQDIERLEAAIRQSKVRIAREQKILRQRRHDMRQANRQLHCPFPGAWPSGSSHSGSENVSRTSQLPTKASLASSELNSGRPDHNIRTGVLHRQNGGVRRPTRARVDTHARHDERPNRHEIASWQRRMLDGLLLAYNSGADTVWNALPNRVRRLIGG